MPETTVMEAKRYGVYTCGVNTTLLAAAHRMADEDISALVVVDDDGYLAGIITRTDLIRGYCRFADWQARSVSEFMNPEVISVPLDATLSAVANVLLERHIHRVVVVRDEGEKRRPVAVVSIADLIYHIIK